MSTGPVLSGFIVLSLAFSAAASPAADPISVPVEEPPPAPTDNTLLVTSASGGIAGAALVAGALAWWTDEGITGWGWENSGFFGRTTYAGGADKTGHFFSNYVSIRAMRVIYEKMGVPPQRALWLGAGFTVLLSTAVEVIDGVTPNHFEWPDVVANLTGAGFALALETSPTLDSLLGARIGYIPSPKYLEGEKNYMKTVNDYSGMTFYLDFKPAGLEDSWDLPVGPLRYLTTGATYGTVGYSPRHRPRHRILGFHVGLNVPEILAALFGPDGRALEAAISFTRYYALPMTAVILTRDLNHDRWGVDPATSNQLRKDF